MAFITSDEVRSFYGGRYMFHRDMKRMLRHLFPSLGTGRIYKLLHCKDVVSRVGYSDGRVAKLVSPKAMSGWLAIHGDVQSQDQWSMWEAAFHLGKMS